VPQNYQVQVEQRLSKDDNKWNHAPNFWDDMAEKWQRMTSKTRGTLFGKTFIPFGKEGDIGDKVMTKIIQQHNNFLRSTKQRIVQDLNDIDCPIDIVTGSAEDMDAATVTLRDIFYQYKGDNEGQLFNAIEKTNTGGTYRFLFHEKKIEIIDNMLQFRCNIRRIWGMGRLRRTL
jgi:hypothetical protein